MKTASSTPSIIGPKPPPSGLSQDMENGIDPAGALEEPTLLYAGGELDPSPADPGHQHDPDDRAGDDYPDVVDAVGPAEELVGVDRGDVGQRGHHDHVREEDHPAVDPPEVRPHGARDPSEARAAVRVGLVEVAVGERDQD